MYQLISSWLMPISCIVVGVAFFVRFIHSDDPRIQDTTFNYVLSGMLLYITGTFMNALPMYATDGLLSCIGRILWLLFLGVLGIAGTVVVLTVFFLAIGVLLTVFDYSRKRRRDGRPKATPKRG